MSDFLSVAEFCEKFRKDPGNVRRLIAQGRIPAQKVGKQWIIPADAVPPDDKRIKSGKYRDWRKPKTEAPE